MTKTCINNTSIMQKYSTVLEIMHNMYYSRFNHLSTSVDIKKLGNTWEDFHLKVQNEEDELACVLASRMLQEDDFAFAIYKEIHPDVITMKAALSDLAMDSFLDSIGLTMQVLLI